MKKILNLTLPLAHSDVPVLIEGESGTGKDLIARAIHDELGQTLTGLTMDVAWLQSHLDQPQQAWFEKLRSS